MYFYALWLLTKKAYSYLKEGRKLYPNDTALLFAEINHFLQTNETDQLISTLKLAIRKEPNNISLYTTLATVYDNIHQDAVRNGDAKKAEEYFNKALDRYNYALKKDIHNFDVVYSIGALYFNKAATMTNDLNDLSMDFSKEGMKKYDLKKKEMVQQFDLALPHFQKAESLRRNDMSTLIALKEIYAKKNDLKLMKEFKKRLEIVQNGGTNPTSYFKL